MGPDFVEGLARVGAAIIVVEGKPQRRYGHLSLQIRVNTLNMQTVILKHILVVNTGNYRFYDS
jgi:hypothetical protein